MSKDEERHSVSKMSSSLKENLLDRMRNTHQSSEKNRMARSERDIPPPVRRKQTRFEDLPEYKQVLTQKAASEQLGIANPFYRAHQTAAGATTDVELRRRVSWYEAVALERKALRCFARAPRSPLTGALVAQGHAVLDRLGDRR